MTGFAGSSRLDETPSPGVRSESCISHGDEVDGAAGGSVGRVSRFGDTTSESLGQPDCGVRSMSRIGQRAAKEQPASGYIGPMGRINCSEGRP
jgi:hypothetical protein